MSYGYMSHYVQEDMSESDCPSEGQLLTTDITELYRRKRQVPGSYYPGYFEHQSRPCPCTNFTPSEQLRYCWHKTASPPQEGMFRSSTHLPKSTPSKKYPVTARTPRYYRCSAAPVCKRPSTLCLPVTCQADPAATTAIAHRPRKAAETHRYKGRDYVTTVKKPPEVDSEGDVNSKLNDLENLLTKFDDEDDDDESVELGGVNDLTKILKPKVPATVKAKQEKTKPKVKTLKPPVKKLEVTEGTNEPLDLLLQKLANDSVKKSGDEAKDKSPRTKFMERRPRPISCFEQKPSLDDHSALELHKSKSYIVSLIDKALSKELGTVPGDKCTRKEFLAMNPKKAVDLVNRHMPNRAVSVAQSSEVRKETNFECRTEEPLYLKQLKQLRWSHLRHIQREAKRLADLERFLDSFGEIDSGP